jgi:hypothetical protein
LDSYRGGFGDSKTPLGANEGCGRCDVRNILAVQGEAIDYAHIERWCAQHGTLGRLAEVRASIPPGL